MVVTAVWFMFADVALVLCVADWWFAVWLCLCGDIVYLLIVLILVILL